MAELDNRPPTILRRKQVLARTGYSVSWLYALMARSLFPKPIKIGQRAVGWLESDIDGYINQLVNQSKAS